MLSFNWRKTITIPRVSLKLIAVVILVSLLGCSHLTKEQWQATDNYSYWLGYWTRQGKVYRQLKAALVVTATYVHPSLASAYVDKYAADHLMSPAEREALLAKEQTEEKNLLSFIVMIYTEPEEWGQLGKKNSIWKISLLTDKGEKISPSQVKEQCNPSIYITTFYPNYSCWKKVYRVSFPRHLASTSQLLIDEHTTNFSLVFSSAIGQLQLKWELS